MAVEVPLMKVKDDQKPVPFDVDAGDRIVGFLGNQPWKEVNQLIEDVRVLFEGYMINYALLMKDSSNDDDDEYVSGAIEARFRPAPNFVDGEGR